MQDSVSKRSPTHRWYWRCQPEAQQAAPVPPVAKSTEWAAEPAGPAVPVNLPKTPMTNTPDKAP